MLNFLNALVTRREFILVPHDCKHIVHKPPGWYYVDRRIWCVPLSNERKRIFNVKFVLIRAFCNKHERCKTAVVLEA